METIHKDFEMFCQCSGCEYCTEAIISRNALAYCTLMHTFIRWNEKQKRITCVYNDMDKLGSK